VKRDRACRVRHLRQEEYPDWDNFVASSSQGTLFHKSYWLKASGREFSIYGYFKDGKLFAGLPIVHGVSKFGLRRGSHPPLTPYLGVIFRESSSKYISRVSAEKEMSQAIAARLKEDFHAIRFNFSPVLTDLQPFIWEGFTSGVRYTYLLKPNDLEDVWKGMDAKRRNDIRRAQKDGIYVETSDDFELTFSLVEKSFERQEKEATFRKTAFKYNEVLNQKEQCKSFLARNKDGKAIAVVYIVWDEKRSYYLLGGYDPKSSHHGASAIAMWEAIKFTKEELGLSQFDFEGSMIQPVEQFFRKFGGKLTPYYTVSWGRPSAKMLIATRRLVGTGLRRIGLR